METIQFLSLSSNITTQGGGSKVFIKFVNNSNETLTLQWMDYSGKLVTYATIAPGASLNQDSAQYHVWQLTSADGKVGYKFATNASGEIDINKDYSTTFLDASEKIIQSPNGLWSSSVGYGLINVEASLGLLHTKDLPVGGQNNYAALNAIHAPSAWDAGITGKGVKVAVIDAGIGDSAELKGKIVDGYDFQDNDIFPLPDNGAYKNHALGVASIIAASHSEHAGRDTMGVAPDAQLLNVRVGSSNGSSTANMAKGITWAVDNGAKVICMPLESSSTQNDPGLVNAIHYAYQHNVVVVVIGGNYSQFTPTGPAMIAQQLKGELIDVGNYDLLAGTAFSSSNLPGSSPFPWVMASSSGYVPNLDGGYTYYNDGGTSFAGPYVAGLAALLWQQNPNATASQIINKIVAGASLGQSDALGSYLTQHPDTAPTVTNYQGKVGMDKLTLPGNFNDYIVVHNDDKSFDLINATNRSVNHLVDIERVKFADVMVALDVNKGEAAGEIFRLYQAAFDRQPDGVGFSYWMNTIDQGYSLESIAKSFITSPEAALLYGKNPSNADLVTAMYHNVLHREPDTEGYQYWLDAMNHGTTAQNMLKEFSESAENVAQVAHIIGQGFVYTPYV